MGKSCEVVNLPAGVCCSDFEGMRHDRSTILVHSTKLFVQIKHTISFFLTATFQNSAAVGGGGGRFRESYHICPILVDSGNEYESLERILKARGSVFAAQECTLINSLLKIFYKRAESASCN